MTWRFYALFPTLAAALLATSMIAACNRGTGPSSDLPQSDQDASIQQPSQQPADIPSASTTSDTNAALNSTAPAASATASDATNSASAKTQKMTKHTAKHQRKHHSRAMAKTHAKKKHHRQATRIHARARNEKVAILDLPQSDTQIQNDREEFKRQMQWRVAKIGDGVSDYHNQASITDTLTRYSQKIEDVKVADALAKRQLRNIDTVSNDQWPMFKTNFHAQVSQLERDYESLRVGKAQASR